MADENIDGAVKWLMKRLMQTTAENFDLAFARYEASEREAALAQARRLMESPDPAERELGERLKAEVMRQHASPVVIDVPEENGGAFDPLSRSPLPSLPGAAIPSPASGTPGPDPPPRRGPGRPPKSASTAGSSHPPEGPPSEARPRRGPGRPPKAEQDGPAETPRRGPGRPPKDS